jgi:hypothetical protein
VQLANANTVLRHASLAWFPEVALYGLPKEQEDAERLAEWLSARRGECRRHPLLPLLPLPGPLRPSLACV